MATPRVRNTENMKLKMMEVFEMLKKKHVRFAKGVYCEKETLCRCAVGWLMPLEAAEKFPETSIGDALAIKTFRKVAKKKYADLPIHFLSLLQDWNDALGVEHKADANIQILEFIEHYRLRPEIEFYEHLKK